MKKLKNKYIIFIPLLVIGVLVIFSGGYSYWNKANPEKTCASCHEIRPSVANWQHSAHRDLQCVACHGTALSNGWHSLSEKLGMVTSHASDSPESEELVMKEEQVLAISDKCVDCHQKEYASWSSGAHATTYGDIFLNEEHNKMEPPYWDCFRCHGMFYDGDINDLMERPDEEGGSWKMLHAKHAGVKAIPCLACHKVHTDNEPLTDRRLASLSKEPRPTPVNLYIRTDKRHRRADRLHMVEMVDKEGERVLVSNDPAQRLCMQCHASNAYHQVGTEDDRTPVGVHEGWSCTACHNPHSNSAQNACDKCHTNVSRNCKLDVRTMNTRYLDPENGHDIHTMTCTSCHSEKITENS